MAAGIVPFQRSELNIYYTKTTEELKTDCARYEKLYKTAYKVLSIALIAISLAVFIVSLTAAPTASFVPFLLIGFILFSPILHFASEHLYEKGDAHGRQKATHEKVHSLIQRQNLFSWTNAEIVPYLQQERIQIPESVQQQLQQIDESRSLRILIPLLARYKHHKECALQDQREARRMLATRIDDPISQTIILREGYSHQEKAIQHLLNAALLRVLLCEPTRKEHTYTDLGTLFSEYTESEQQELPEVTYSFQSHKKDQFPVLKFGANPDLLPLQQHLMTRQELPV